jgi:hypothetical protein
MPSLSLTDLVDVVSKAGTPKATKVIEIKHRKSYAPATDFYRPLRDALVDIHRRGRAPTSLDAFLAAITDVKKRSNYPEVIDGYKQWWGKKNLVWFDPPRATYGHAGVDVAVNPELGLVINDTRYVIKLYFKADAATKLRVDLITVLMEVALRPRSTNGEVVALLDVRRAKLFTLGAAVPATKAVVDAELAYIAALWPSV